MTNREVRDALAALLRETGAAHHRAYIEFDGADDEWPLWYAAYLQPRLIPLMGVSCTQSQLVYLLLSAEKRHQQEAPQEHWADFYAQVFLEQYRPLVNTMQGQPGMLP